MQIGNQEHMKNYEDLGRQRMKGESNGA